MSRIAIVGPTASGKSAVALAVARSRPGAEIVSVDSMQVYRGMDIGTASPAPADRAEVAHHMVDILDPTEECTVGVFQRRALDVLDDLDRRGVATILVGGTGLYVRAVVDRLEIPGRFPEVRTELEVATTEALHQQLVSADPVAARKIEPANRRRLLRALEVTLGSGRPFSSYGPGIDDHPPAPFPLFGLRVPREILDQRIDARFRAQVDAGLLDEIDGLADVTLSRTARRALGYQELLAHRRGELTLDEAIEHAVRRIRRFARRQERWFRRDPRIQWIDVTNNPLAAVDTVLSDFPTCS
jgi:tRNA dimethylallyltransferase